MVLKSWVVFFYALLYWVLPKKFVLYCPTASLWSRKAYSLDLRASRIRPYANKMVALKVPMVHFGNCSQVKGNDCCKQERVLVLSAGVVESLARFTDKHLFPETTKKTKLAHGHTSCFCNVYAIMWTEKCMGGLNVHMSLRSLVSLFGHTGQEYFFTWATQDYYPTVCIVVQD